MLNPFTPGTTKKLRATGSTSAVALGQSSTVVGQQVLVTSPAGGPLAFIKFGASGVLATAADIPILPGTAQKFSIPGDATYMAAITGSSSATLYATSGQGQ